jgi:hypothetical protein
MSSVELWHEVDRISHRLERAADKPAEVRKLALQLRALSAEAQRVRPNAARKNPLVSWLNPPKGSTFGKHVLAIVYEHQEDGELYAHGFGDKEVDVRQRGEDLILTGIPHRTNVLAQALPDGSVLLKHKDGKRIWQEF